MSNTRNRTPSSAYWPWFVFALSGLSLRNIARALSSCTLSREVTFQSGSGFRNTTLRRKYVIKEKKMAEYVVDETLIKVGSELVWLWVAIEPKNKQILALTISKERNMFVAEVSFGHWSGSWKASGFHRWWYMVSSSLPVPETEASHAFSFEKSLIERTMQYIKDRTECFDDYFPCRKAKCNLHHIKNWLNLFVKMHNKMAINA